MNWTELLKCSVEAAYPATDALMAKLTDAELGWKPATGSNWMTVGQLLMHLTNACGACCQGFATGDWGMPADLPAEAMLPPAAKLPAVASVAEARQKLAADKALALKMIAQVGEADLQARQAAAPWDPTHPRSLGENFLGMIGHLNSHKSQLFYYLKLMGKPVHTGDLWGM
ncbi:MAG: DinB family protein [Candidatus Krumholzibacteriia bacterium]